MNSKYKKLFDSLKFPCGISTKNKLVMSPMTTWSANADGTVSDEELNYYDKRINGVGLTITACTFVTPNGQGFANEFAAYDDKFIPSLKRLASTIKKNGSIAILQIFHAGNKAVPNLVPNMDIVSASTVAAEIPGMIDPRELSHEEILKIIDDFGEATRRAIEAGFDGVEIHGAHGFLIQNFLSPFYNKRTDEWGGTVENRLRFPLAIVEEIKRTIKEYATKPFILGYRFSPEEPLEGGLRIEDTNILLDCLIKLKIDYIHASLGDILSAKPINSEGEKRIIEFILQNTENKIPLIAAGLIRTPDDAIKALELGLPLIALGQALIMNPNWIELVENGLEHEIETSIKTSKIDKLYIPKNLWNAIEKTPGWFQIEK